MMYAVSGGSLDVACDDYKEKYDNSYCDRDNESPVDVVKHINLHII